MTRNEALRLRSVIEQTVQSADDTTALTVVNLHPAWAADSAYSAGYKVRREDKLWRCIQGHTALTGWEPENAPSLWEQINEVSTGTREDPIPYEGNMALTAGLYYTQDGVVYLCTRDTVNPVYSALRDLVGLYVEEVN